MNEAAIFISLLSPFEGGRNPFPILVKALGLPITCKPIYLARNKIACLPHKVPGPGRGKIHSTARYPTIHASPGLDREPLHRPKWLKKHRRSPTPCEAPFGSTSALLQMTLGACLGTQPDGDRPEPPHSASGRARALLHQ